MRFYLLLAIMLWSCLFNVQAQTVTSEPASEPVESNWTRSWVINLNGNQASYRNWSQGGANSIAFIAGTLFRVKYNGEKFSNTSRINLRFGQADQDEIGIQKTEDLIRLSNKTDYFLHDNRWSAFFEVAFRTQFAPGFDDNTGSTISDFMSPGYFTESLGISYQPVDYFSTQLGLGLKQTFVELDGLDQFYGLGEDEDIRGEGGITFAFDFTKELVKNFTYTTEFNSFTNLLIPVSSTDLYMSNIFTGKINDFMSSSIEFSFLYDDDFISKLQIKQIISVGFNIVIL
ncbi:MAG: DUF3078 domain-containing protein [Balneolaceae bacterium]